MNDARPRSDSGPLTGSEPAEALSAGPRLDIVERPSCNAEDEPMGGDPPCWAHLFEDEEETPAGR